MLHALLHLTPHETPIVWLALVTGIAIGSLGTALLLRRRRARA